MDFLKSRRDKAGPRLLALQKRLEKADFLARGKACIYLTGSYGRGEASEYSDLDLFIVGMVTEQDTRVLTKLDEILIKAQLIEATRGEEFPDFSGDGEYLSHYTVNDIVSTLGERHDDATNTFTARLLLLLESRPLLGDEIYSEVISKVIKAYWKDFNGHETDFVPAFLANDILRLWRTFCVNYEAGNRNEKESEEQKAKRKVKNYKLKHSRLLTCYSALVYLMAVMAEQGTVNQENAKQMVFLSPTERLEWLKKQPKFVPLSKQVNEIIQLYTNFLQKTDAPKDRMIEMFMDPKESNDAFQKAKDFGDQVYKLICLMGEDNKVFRILVV